MKFRLIIALVVTCIAAACALPQRVPQAAPTTPVSNSEIATQVSKYLTSVPPQGATAIVLPTQPGAIPTVTLPPQPTLAPTAPPVPTTSPTNTPENTPVNTPAPTATSTANPTATAPATDPRTKLGNPTWEDTFKNDNNWPMGDDKFTHWEVKDNSMVITPLTQLDGWRLTWPDIKDFYLEMTAKSTSCSDADHYGMIFRVPDIKTADQGYLFGISCDGKYSLRTWDGKKMNYLVKWTASSAILSGPNQVNRMGVMAVGKQIRLYVNGTLLKEVSDETLSEGGFGLFIGSAKPEQMSLTVQNIRYWNNPTP